MPSFLALLARLSIAAIFFLSGFGKILDHAHTVEMMGGVGIPYAGGLFYATVAVELGGGLLLALGTRARFAAFLLAAFLVPVTYYFHFHPGDRMQTIQLLKNLAIFGGLLQIVAFGPGRISLDRK
ncbi:MAG: DoxX family protein [Pseudomonadota bacterium]